MYSFSLATWCIFEILNIFLSVSFPNFKNEISTSSNIVNVVASLNPQELDKTGGKTKPPASSKAKKLEKYCKLLSKSKKSLEEKTGIRTSENVIFYIILTKRAFKEINWITVC